VEGFRFTNQLGEVFDTRSLAGRPWVADLIFTRCPGPCLKLTRNLAELQRQTGGRPVQFLSLTADPEFDTPSVLRAYAARFGADPARWQFLTGPRVEINRVAMQQLLLAVEEKDPAQRESENDLYLHSTKWVLVDGEGRLRSVHEGTDPGSVSAVLRDLKALEREARP
jgi:protein SCO1/2